MKTKNQSERLLLLSIRKPYSQLILVGKKTFELRKRPPKQKCRYALLYETSPTKAIVGIFEIDSILHNNVNKIWKITKKKACISHIEFKNYYKDKKYGVALGIKKVIAFKRKILLSEIGIDYVPQDFAYIDKKEIANLIRI